jgi:hypothetical protein
MSFITKCAGMGYAKTKKEVITLVEGMLSEKYRSVTVSNGWWESFKQKHPTITLRSAEKLSYARLVASNPDVINRYFDLLEKTLSTNDLLDNPSRIFNCDESGLPLDHCPSSVITTKGQKHARVITSGNKKQITVLACGNAAGYVIPPLVIFARKTFNAELAIGEIPSTMYGLSDNGWMTSDIFEHWFMHHFLVHAPAARPLLLILDGHSTHYSPSFITKTAHEMVIVFCLPPNTTHLTQPLDKGAFGPLKTYWHEECQRYMSKNPGKVITQYEFMQIFSRAWYCAMTPQNLIGAFRTTGVYPLNRNVVEVYKATPMKSESLSKKTGIAFIPLYSPEFEKLSNPSYDDMSEGSDNDFTEEEQFRFRRRYEEGYDIKSDTR